MDVEWCLVCERHLDSPGPFCSKQCGESKPTISILDTELSISDDDNDQEIRLLHDVQRASWRAKDDICGWVADIPVSSAAEAPSSADFNTAASYSIPALLKEKPLMPSLCMCIPDHNKPSQASKRVMSPQQYISAISSSISNRGSVINSPATESSVETPSDPIQIPSPPKPSILGTLTSHVRSWVGSPLSRKVSPPATSQASQKPFAVFAKCHEPLKGIQISLEEEDFSSDSSAIDLNKVWWEASPSHSLSRSHVANIAIQKPRTEHRTRAVGTAIAPALRPRDDHPAYRSRGRKTSKFIA
ncbi:hypothetical protein C8J56DRAFT_956777 [Mycena floridula]|nr:hypothetical protein C8J56DRAFT_956777 [Mycena floridula]